MTLPLFRTCVARRVAAALSLLVVSLLAAEAAGQSVDRVRRRTGVDSGKIAAVTPLGVTLSRGGVDTTIPTEEIVSVSYAGEPQQLNSARNAVQAGRYDEALQVLAALPASALRREEIGAEAQFYAAVARARQALAGQGGLAEATASVKEFMTSRRTSFHVPAAIELLGDLYVAQRQYDAARQQYGLLAKAKSPYYELRSALLTGRAWQAEGRSAEALREFSSVVTAGGEGPLVDAVRLEARLAQAVSQAATGDVEAATRDVAAIIAAASADDEALLAQAYLALGDCYRRAGDRKGALFAYLHVDLLFNSAEEAHNAALRALVELWQELGYPDRAQETQQKLAESSGGGSAS